MTIAPRVWGDYERVIREARESGVYLSVAPDARMVAKGEEVAGSGKWVDVEVWALTGRRGSGGAAGGGGGFLSAGGNQTSESH